MAYEAKMPCEVPWQEPVFQLRGYHRRPVRCRLLAMVYPALVFWGIYLRQKRPQQWASHYFDHHGPALGDSFVSTETKYQLCANCRRLKYELSIEGR